MFNSFFDSYTQTLSCKFMWKPTFYRETRRNDQQHYTERSLEIFWGRWCWLLCRITFDKGHAKWDEYTLWVSPKERFVLHYAQGPLKPLKEWLRFKRHEQDKRLALISIGRCTLSVWTGRHMADCDFGFNPVW